ncbi:hypothetical protein PISL3812_04941 [Talaromyces islandicus]|uniref:Uncharacterized protein n=1 Tax=Talaromyces islandicus TaxID=28573 RepID=A0A0U1LX10_TALIS|nr:hypothetical protein PISL3812_04941 [Talaromyces islandicus]
MGDISSSRTSLTPSSSVGTVPSEGRQPERWWRWGSHSPKQPIIANHSESLILTQRRNRKQPRNFPEPELYSGETDTDARKRMRLIPGTFVSHDGKSLRTSSERGDNMGKLKKGESVAAAPFDTGAGAVPEADIKTAKKIQLLKREIDLLGLHHDRKTSTLKQDIEYLKEENFALCRKLDWCRTQHEAKAGGSYTSDEVEALNAELERRNVEIEEKIKQNSSLEQQLNTAEGLSAVLRDLQDENNVSVIFSEDLVQLETAMNQAALLLVQCFSDEQLSNVQKAPRKNQALNSMIKSSLGKMSILASRPRIAFSALLFCFTRERVFYSDCWTALQLEGYMLRGYQEVIQRITPRGTLETLHRAALQLMLEENDQFRDCWVQSQVEEVRCELLRLLSPLIEASKMKIFDKDIRTALDRVFTRAFHFRARCVPPKGARYELLQIKAGDIFDPEYMEAQTPDGSIQSVPSGKVCRVKLCIHGCLVLHVIENESFDEESRSTISQPFLSVYDRDQAVEKKLEGVLKSGKAIVILEDDSLS